jgi:hypothetical protein
VETLFIKENKMVEELKLITDLFSNATENALYAYITYILYQLLKTSLIVFPLVNVTKFVFKHIFVKEEK